MATENVSKLVETIQSFVGDLQEIQEATDMRTAAMIERRAVNKLQLAQVEVEMAGRDLYAIATRVKARIRRGDIYEDNKPVDAGRSESKPVDKTKRTNRRSRNSRGNAKAD